MVRIFCPAKNGQGIQTNIPDSSIVECNVLYPSPRQTTEGHRETLRTNGWTFCPVDIMDEDGDVSLPIPGGKWLTELSVGKHILNYDAMLVLTHFKGHTVGGFGGSLKNISIGCASGETGQATDPSAAGRRDLARRLTVSWNGWWKADHVPIVWRLSYLYQRAPEHVRGLRLRRAQRQRHHAGFGIVPRRIFWPSIRLVDTPV